MGGAGQYGETGGVVRVDAEDGWSADVPARNCHLVNERDDTLDDLVKSDYLHEAGCVVFFHQSQPGILVHILVRVAIAALACCPGLQIQAPQLSRAHLPKAMQTCIVTTSVIGSSAH